MPGLDGTGPQGQGPMTGRGEGYCAVRLPEEPGQSAYGYAGLQGTPVQMGIPATRPTFWTRFARWLRPMWPGRAPGCGSRPGNMARSRRGQRRGGGRW
jgi:hypothetical protein